MKITDGMKVDKRLSFIFVWRLNDWGLFNRRHEALARELSKRDGVESVLHIEHISFRGLLSLMIQWLREKDGSLRKAYAEQVKKGFSVIPVRTAASRKLFVYSVLVFYSGENGILKKINEIVKQMQYGMMNIHNNHFRSKKIIVVYPPSGLLPEAIKFIKHDVLIADLVDDSISRASIGTKRNFNKENMKAILPNCRWIFSTSPAFNREYKEYAEQEIDYLPNGVDMTELNRPQNICFPGNGKKIIGYIGIMNREVDLDLLEYIMSHNIHADFVMIGKATDEIFMKINGLTAKHKNLFYLGPKSHNEIPGFMDRCDVLINVKKNDYTTSGADSIKIYEYLATGKPIVATPMPPAEKFADLIYVTSDKQRFVDYIYKALDENDGALREKRIKVAMDNSWTKRVDVILDKVAQL
jgi:glycosyltransferase involved in cell wall biosynthesis